MPWCVDNFKHYITNFYFIIFKNNFIAFNCYFFSCHVLRKIYVFISYSFFLSMKSYNRNTIFFF